MMGGDGCGVDTICIVEIQFFLQSIYKDQTLFFFTFTGSFTTAKLSIYFAHKERHVFGGRGGSFGMEWSFGGYGNIF